MAKYKLEYLWLDGYEPVANLRGKTQIKEFKAFPKLEEDVYKRQIQNTHIGFL